MSKKINVAILFGGRSPEHQISLLSAKNVIEQIDRKKYNPVLVGIDKSGRWLFNEGSLELLNSHDANRIAMGGNLTPVLMSQNTDEHTLISQNDHSVISKIDVLFPVLHGTYGEDGTVQGFARLANLPCVGCGILGSSLGMDKDVTKRLLRDAGIGVADFVTIRHHINDTLTYQEIAAKLGPELFLKPANLGSSVGVALVKNKEEFEQGLLHGFLYDPKVIVEEKIVGREIECAVLGNENPKASVLGEVLTGDGWYSFDNKYVDETGSTTVIPADLDEETQKQCKALAIKTYQVLECEGMSRVDMFLKENGDILVNEINTIPGFTNISMYPQLWKASGLSYQALISKLIDLAIDSHKKRNALK